MRVKTDQQQSFADSLVSIPESELDVLENIIDWCAIEALLLPTQGDYRALSLFKALLIQTWHELSDERLSQALKRDLVYMNFCGFTLEGNKPDSATLCRFRNRCVKAGVFESGLGVINECLAGHQLKLNTGKYVSCDATLIQSTRRPRKCLDTASTDDGVDVVYSDDADARWLTKGSQAVYGYSASVISDEDGLVEHVRVYPANESEMTRFDDTLSDAPLMPGQVVLYDKGVDSQANRSALKARGLKDGLMRKKPKGRAMSHWNRLRNRLIGQKRFVVERTFGTLKRSYGLDRARYVGRVKVEAEVFLKSIAYNLRRGMTLAMG